jgi:hypothetical protein
MIKLKKYQNITDKFNSLFTFVIYDTKFNDFKFFLKEKLEKIQNISNNYKKKYLNDRLYNFILYIEDNYKDGDIINSLYLISNKIDEYPLTEELEILRYFNIKNILYFNDEYYKIDYIEDLFYNKDYKHILNINNKNLKYFLITKTKSKLIEEVNSSKLDVNEYIKDKKIKICLIHGISSYIKKLEIKPHLIYNKNLNNEEILKEFYKYNMNILHKRLSETIDLIKNEKTLHRVVFGKDIINSINYNQIKTLFCSPKKLKKVFDTFDNDLLNFEILEIKPIYDGDISERFRKDFNGIIGYTYY